MEERVHFNFFRLQSSYFAEVNGIVCYRGQVLIQLHRTRLPWLVHDGSLGLSTSREGRWICFPRNFRAWRAFMQPSIQKLVSSVIHDLLSNGINEETLRNLPPLESLPHLHLAAKHLRAQFPGLQLDYELLEKATQCGSRRVKDDEENYNGMVRGFSSILLVCLWPSTRSRT